jgi:hypothetical protein
MSAMIGFPVISANIARIVPKNTLSDPSMINLSPQGIPLHPHNHIPQQRQASHPY